MTRRPGLLWIIAIAIGWLFDLLFWKKAVGVNFSIFLSICLVGGFLLLAANGLKPAPMSLWLLTLYAFFACFIVFRREPLTLFLTYAFSLISLCIFGITYLGGRWLHYSLLDYLTKSIKLFIGIIVQPIEFYFQSEQERKKFLLNAQKFPILSVLRGLLIALPIIVILGSLLSSADVVFGQMFTDFLKRFDVGRIPELIIRFMIIVSVAFGLAGVFLHASSHSRDEKLIGEDKPVLKQFLGFTEAAIVLGSVTLLFFLFVIVQFRYFFGGEVNIGVEGYTYSVYARSGFNELVRVALISLFLLLAFHREKL